MKITKVTINKTKKPTWNITVKDNHNYFVNGILAKNSEKPLPPYGCCLLGSINMGMFPTDKAEYKRLLNEKTYNLARLVDNAITYELENHRYAVKEQAHIMRLTREIGLGVTNLHQWFLNQDLQYDSDEAIKVAGEFMKEYAFSAFMASLDLADEKGPCDVYDKYQDINKSLMNSSFFKNVVNELFEGDYSKIGKLRNLALMSIAPTGSLSMTFPDPALSSGIEPIIAPAYWRKTRVKKHSEYDYYFVLPKAVRNYLLERLDGEDKDFISKIQESTLDNGGELGIEVMDIINKHLGDGFFKPAHKIDPFQKIKLMSEIYHWVDAAASVTYNLPPECTKETIQEIYMQAWDHGVRAVSVYREGSREGILVFDPPETDQKKPDSFCETRPEEILFTCAPKRPKDLKCEIHHCKVMGNDWIVIVGMFEGYPYEIFAGEENKEEMYIPQTVKDGVLRKNGKSYSLIISIRKNEIEYKNIADLFMNLSSRSLTRLISLSLRHGVRPIFIINQLKKANEGITEFSSVVSRVLKKYVRDLDYSNFTKPKKCEVCGSIDFSFENGCKKCINCGAGACD